MYDKLSKRLWECASGECFNCSQYTPTTNASVCQKELMKQAADAIEELVGKTDTFKWIPVADRLPQICTNVLAAGRMKYRWEHKYFQFVDKAYFNEGEFFETDNDWYEGQDEFEITHWMPLPEPPKEE